MRCSKHDRVTQQVAATSPGATHVKHPMPVH